MAVNLNFDIEKGSDFNISYVYSDTQTNPIDLSSKCVIISISGDDGTLRRYSNRVLSNYADNGWSLVADNLGAIDFRLSAEETLGYNFTTAVYDLDIKEQDTIKLNNIRLSEGIINLINRRIPITAQEIIECPSNIDPLVALPSTSTPSVTSLTPTPSSQNISDFCLPYDCNTIDLFSTVYSGSGINISDMSTSTGNVIVNNNNSTISNIELAINRLSHNSPTDLIFILSPPSGDKILLSANHKISNFNNNFSFMFSNKADPGKYLHNINNGQVCNIYDKTSEINYSNENLLSSFDHLFGYSVTGVWSLIIKDNDPGGSGSIESWKLVITYDSNIPIEIPTSTTTPTPTPTPTVTPTVTQI